MGQDICMYRTLSVINLRLCVWGHFAFGVGSVSEAMQMEFRPYSCVHEHCLKEETVIYLFKVKRLLSVKIFDLVSVN